MTEDLVRTETRERVGVITLNRPDALNALNGEMMRQLAAAARKMDDDAGIGCIVITGSDKAFAAGADIKEMQPKDYAQVYHEDMLAEWEVVSRLRTPTIAAVAGHALGGGCELAMMCDIVIAADTARFGQPEIKLGTIPGMGGTQRLTRAVGKAKAMELCLTGRTMKAEEAERAGLVAHVVPADAHMDSVLETAQTIAGMSLPVAMACKEAVDTAQETTLAQGVRFERRTFHATFAFDDRAEGMSAFTEKRSPHWKHR